MQRFVYGHNIVVKMMVQSWNPKNFQRREAEHTATLCNKKCVWLRRSQVALGAFEDEVGDELDEGLLGRAQADLAQVELDLLHALAHDPLAVEQQVLVPEARVLCRRPAHERLVLLRLQLVVLRYNFLSQPHTHTHAHAIHT